MKTPKEKAEELIEKFKCYVDYQGDDCFTEIEKMLINAKKCALIAVDEILEECRLQRDWYWEEVKQEIEKL